MHKKAFLNCILMEQLYLEHKGESILNLVLRVR